MAKVTVVLYIAAIVAANLTATAFVQVGFIQFAVGTLFFGAIFTLRDRIHSSGRGFVYKVIGVALVVNVVVALATATPLRIILASFVALALSEIADTEVYQALKRRSWLVRVFGSNAVSIPLDTVLFCLIAFAGVLPGDVLLSLIIGDIVVKALISTVLALWQPTPVKEVALWK